MGEGQQQGGTQARAGTGNGGGEKTDDEILADALGEFDKGLNKAQQEGAEQGEAGNQGASASIGEGQGTLTDEERSGKLDEQLNNKFAKFDDLMLGEREAVAKSDNEGGAGTYGSGNGNGNYDDDPLQTAMVEGSSKSGSLGVKSERPTDSISEAPSDVGDGQDDDIIARQLREAAQKERDPELRAKLCE